jgi:small nuclear ribonucleoprotein (snRNP)-like protein
MMMLRRRDEGGIVGVNLALVIAFALYAVIQLSRVVLAASQIDDRVKVIITEVGPGSNVSRLDETQKLNETGRMAEEILVAAQNLSARAGTIIDTAGSIDSTVSQILTNATEINGTVRSIDSITKQLLPVVQTIHGDDSLNVRTGGVAAINKRALTATPVVGGIQTDLNRTNVLGTLVSVDKHAVAICKSVVVGLVCPGVTGPVADPAPNVP